MSIKTIQGAIGQTDFDLVIKNVNFVNIFSKEIYKADIGICDGRIAHVTQPKEKELTGENIYDGKDKFAIPGLIDTHVHTESSMMTPGNMAKAIIPHGTTTIACDPHEIANVLGIQGVEYILESSKDIPLNLYVLAPSCLPSALNVETNGATFNGAEIDKIFNLDRVIGLGEVMDFPGVISQDPRMIDIINTAKKYKCFLQGHTPSLTGRKLSAYQASGVNSCHETSFTEEAMYKLRAGMTLECRESSIVQDIAALAPALKACNYPPNATICTDDREPDDLLRQGHIDYVIKRCIEEGLPPIEVIKMATYNAAILTKLNEHGSLIPGNFADIVLLDDLNNFEVNEVFIKGKLIAKEGSLVEDFTTKDFEVEEINTIKLSKPITEEDFKISHTKEIALVNIIKFNQEIPILTDLETIELPVKDGYIDISNRDDLAILTVFERHGKNGNKSICFVKDLGLKNGAIGSTVSHDSHNLVVVGKNIADMLQAANTLCKVGGGFVCIENSNITSLLELPIAGLMSKDPINIMAPKTSQLKSAIRNLGLNVPSPIIQVAAFALPVVPNIRLTDYGLVDVNTQQVLKTVIS